MSGTLKSNPKPLRCPTGLRFEERCSGELLSIVLFLLSFFARIKESPRDSVPEPPRDSVPEPARDSAPEPQVDSGPDARDSVPESSGFWRSVSADLLSPEDWFVCITWLSPKELADRAPVPTNKLPPDPPGPLLLTTSHVNPLISFSLLTASRSSDSIFFSRAVFSARCFSVTFSRYDASSSNRKVWEVSACLSCSSVAFPRLSLSGFGCGELLSRTILLVILGEDPTEDDDEEDGEATLGKFGTDEVVCALGRRGVPLLWA